MGQYGYREFVGMYNGSSHSSLTSFAHNLCAIVALVVAVGVFALGILSWEWIVGQLGQLPEWVPTVIGLAWFVACCVLWFFIFGYLMSFADSLLAPYEERRRQKFRACPECGEETEIIEDELLEEKLIKERSVRTREKGKTKTEVEHYWIGVREVVIACQSCDYEEEFRLKFKHRA